ncbi:Nucleolar protein 4 [Papilio machaon]|uniref:Nucleolar protein 4 n=1 Tax=Papilio machaon TaxID=76193 RepID=A0A0N1IHW6_PAPMA|nr:Nucleolar protein 4 [Papilio machaon]
MNELQPVIRLCGNRLYFGYYTEFYEPIRPIAQRVHATAALTLTAGHSATHSLGYILHWHWQPYTTVSVSGAGITAGGSHLRSLYDPPATTALNAPNQEPVYRKVAIVENFFDIIYTVHVELEGRPGKHAGQKRTYRTITETYAFLPREAVTRFLTGCAECARRPRSASPPPLPTPSPSPTRHPPYLPFLPHCAADYTRNWESEIDAAHSNYPYEPKFDYTELQPLKKVESPKPTDTEDQEPTYIELTSKKVNGFDSTPLLNRSSSVEPAFSEEQPVRTDPEIDKDENSLIDVEDVKVDDSPPPLVPEEKQEVEEEKVIEESDKESIKVTENVEVTEPKVEVKKEKKYNPLDVANLTSKDPPKSRSPPRKKLLPTTIECANSYGRYPRPWRPDGGLYYAGEDVDYSVPITTAYLKHMRSIALRRHMRFLPREAVTRFLTGCAECARRPRSASPPPLPTPSPSPTRHPPYLPFLPHCAADYTRNWESEIDAAHSNYPYEPKFDYTELQPLKKVESPKPTDTEDQEPTYIELTSKKVNGFDSTPLLNRSSSVEPAFSEEQPVRTDPEIDKDENSLIDVEDVKVDDSPPPLVPEEKQEVEEEKVIEESDKESIKATENVEVTEPKVEVKKEKKYNPLDVANLTSKDPPKSRSPPRKKLLPTTIECTNSYGRYPRPWRPDGGLYYAGEDVDYSVPITTAYLKHMRSSVSSLKHMRSIAYQDSLDGESKSINLAELLCIMHDEKKVYEGSFENGEKSGKLFAPTSGIFGTTYQGSRGVLLTRAIVYFAKVKIAQLVKDNGVVELKLKK